MKWQNVPALTFAILVLFMYLFTLSNLLLFYYSAVFFGLSSIPLTYFFYRREIAEDMKYAMVQVALLFIAFFSIFSFFLVVDRNWAINLPVLFFVPVLVEEFNFRYVLQRILLRSINRYGALLIQAVLYVLYYSRYVVADNGAGYPFPYNLLMLFSVTGMALIYGLLAAKTKNFIASTTLHFVIWGLFPLLAAYPALASVLVQT